MFTGFLRLPSYSAEITDTVQTDSQEPQSMQVSLISYLVSPSEIAETGQTDCRANQYLQPGTGHYRWNFIFNWRLYHPAHKNSRTQVLSKSG